MLHILLSSLGPIRRGRLAYQQALLFFFLLLSFLGLRGEEMVNPQIKTWKSFLHLNSLIFVLDSYTNGFEMCWGNRKRDVTVMVTYSHASTPLGQSERAYYLSYSINAIGAHSYNRRSYQEQANRKLFINTTSENSD